jgi:molybdopterin-guanine dinucleotide biosynthesis protein A
MPYLTADLIEELVGPSVRLGADVVLPWDGRDHYLAGVYRTDLAARAEQLVATGERSMRALVDAVDTQRVVMPEQRALTNVNDPTALP